MHSIVSRPKTVVFPVTLETPFGSVKLELTPCQHCGEHFNYRLVESAPLLSTRAAEPFLYRLMNSLNEIGSDLWMTLPPDSVRAQIQANTYQPPRLKLPEE